MEKFNNALNDVINCIKDSKEYKMCISLKKEMEDNEEINSLIEEVKKYQKKYVKSNYDDSIKVKLDDLNNKLLNIPIYSVYNDNLKIVNEKIDYVRDTLNDYFYNLLNNKTD